jgi:hypothetical protein
MVSIRTNANNTEVALILDWILFFNSGFKLFQPDTGVIDEKKSQNNLSPLYKDKDNTERTKKQSKHPKPHTLFQ